MDMFNDTSRYLDDILTIDNPKFEKHILNIYPTDKLRYFWLHSFCYYWEGWDPVNRFNHTSLVAVVTPTNRP